MLSKTESGPRHCSVRLVPLLWLITLCFCFADLNPRQSCGQGYHLCSPAGASFRDIPEVGPGLAKLYLNLIATINPQPAPARVFGRSRIADGGLTTDGLDSAGLFCFAKGEQDDALTTYCSDNGYWCSDLEGGAFSDAVYYTDDNISACDKNCECAQRLREQPAQSKVARGVSFPTRRVRETPVNLCCADTTDCMLLLSYDVPLCWDKFTTNYYLPDGSYGSIISGNYTTPDGSQANLVTGNYRLANGQMGNIYQGDTLDEPNTASLPIPTPWTSSGVGSAIPASQVGSQAFTNSSGMPSLLSLTITSATSTTGFVTSPTIASATSTTSSLVSNVTTVSGDPVAATSGAATSGTTPAPSTAGPTQPEITPPVTSEAVMPMCGGIYGLWLLAVLVSHLVMH